MGDRSFRITREIGIDAGHRVTNHHSKCSNLHGHRYTIQATVRGHLATAGSIEGMAGGMDFGFIKEEMMAAIDAPCDHALILWAGDPLLATLIKKKDAIIDIECRDALPPSAAIVFDSPATHCGKMYVIGSVPTAENLAAHWFDILTPRIEARSDGAARLIQLRVYETPNCWADAYAK